MDMNKAIESLTALAQETRLEIFRLLVRAGADGLAAGEIVEALGARQNTTSTNLGILARAGLLRRRREGRAIRYFVDFEGVRRLLAYLLEDCCCGTPEAVGEALGRVLPAALYGKGETRRDVH